MRTLEGHSFSVTGVAATSDGRYAVTQDWKGHVVHWDVTTGQVLWEVDDALGGFSLALAENSRYLVCGGSLSQVVCYEVATGRHVRTLSSRRRGNVSCVAITPDGRFVLASSDDGTLAFWDLASGSLRRLMTVRDLPLAARSSISPMYVSPNGEMTVRDLPLVACSLMSDGRFGASGDAFGTARYWDLSNGRCIGRVTIPDWITRGNADHMSQHPLGYYASDGRWVFAPFSLTLTSDGEFAIFGGADRHLHVWSVYSGECVRISPGHAGVIRAAAVTPDCRFVFSGGEDRLLHLWRLEWDYAFGSPDGETPTEKRKPAKLGAILSSLREHPRRWMGR